MPSPAPPPPEAEKPRLVCRYQGMQIFNARDRIVVVLSEDPPHGIRGGLKVEGFQRQADGSWAKPHSVMAIMEARAVGSAFCGDEI